MRVKLGDVATYINGYAFKPSDWSDTGVPIIRIQDLTGNSYQANRYNGEYAKKYEVLPGDVLISWSASLGVYIWAGEKAVLNQHIFKVVFDKCPIDKSFFVHQVQEILSKAGTSAHGATMKHLTKPVFDALPFYLPPLNKQCHIAAVLDKVSDLIAKRRQQLDKLDELVKARFVEMFGTENDFDQWDCCRICDVADIGVGVVIKPTQYYADEGIPAFRSLNVGEMHVNDYDWVYFTKEGHQKNQKSVIHRGDVLVVRSGAPGTACVATEKYEGYNAVDIIIAHPDNRKVNSVFLAAFTNMPHGMNQIRAKTGGAAQQHFNVGGYKSMRLIMPSIELQNQFAAFVTQTEKTKAAVQQALEKLETLKKALMQEYFGGEV